jgi:hypothetical protein
MLQLDFASYIEEYQRDKTRWKQVFGKTLPRVILPYRETVLTTWEVSYKAIELRDSYAAHLLALCGFVGAEDIPVDLFRTELTNNGMATPD